MKCNNDIILVHPQSKFALELTFTDAEGNVIDPASHTFRYIYANESGRNGYEVSRNAETDTFVNCYLKDGKLYARFENYTFSEGQIYRTAYITQYIVPDAGQGFTDNTELIIDKCPSVIVITKQVNCTDCVVGYENFVYPCVVGGLTPTQAQQEINEYLYNKKLIAQAITEKGVPASDKDTASELAEKVMEIPNITVDFETSGSINPKWTDLTKIIADHYREDRRYCWAFSFLGDNITVTLTGGEYYICSDGYETSTSGPHTFAANTDPAKHDNWVIIYTQYPTYVFPDSLAERVVGAASYNTQTSNIVFNNTQLSYLIMLGEVGTMMLLPQNYVNGTGVSFFNVPQGVEELTIDSQAFMGSNLSDITLPDTLTKISIDTNAFNGLTIDLNEIKTTEEITLTGGLAYVNFLDKEEFVLQSKSITIQGAGSFTNVALQKLSIIASESLIFQQSNQYIFLNSIITELYMANPENNFSMSINAFYGSGNMRIITLQDGWNWSINLTYVVNQTLDSIEQNAHAVADRTGQTALTYTIGATKLANVQANRPEIISTFQSKNWNIN